ncbi:MAG: hypothetical protein KDK99_01000 [Verrucomicrobiales bacterium]|nr:hypothetical protein [Verrucomicrobiales bacterium]
MWDAFLNRLGSALQNEAKRKQILGQFWRLIRRMMALSGWAWIFLASGVFLAMHWIGERNLTTGFLLFLPPVIWFLPLLFVLPACLIAARKTFLFVLLITAWLLYWGLDWRPGAADELLTQPSTRGPNTLTVLTNNRGQHAGQSLQPFKNLTQPDLMVFQEASARAAGYLNAPGYTEFIDAKSIGEFTLLSRFPIKTAELLPNPDDPSKPHLFAARFVVAWRDNQEIAVYSVHLPSPRDFLLALRRGAFLYGVLGVAGGSWSEKKQHYESFFDQHLRFTESLLQQVRSDPLPVVVAGDFNAPSVGYIHTLLTQDLADTQETSGSGFGFTFPGTTHNPLSLGGPWIRIDCLFVSTAWRSLASMAEPERRSQHRAACAVLEFQTTP